MIVGQLQLVETTSELNENKHQKEKKKRISIRESNVTGWDVSMGKKWHNSRDAVK